MKLEIIPDSRLTDDERLSVFLKFYNIPDTFVIEEEAKEMLLMAFEQDIAACYLDDEGGLIIEYNGEEY